MQEYFFTKVVYRAQANFRLENELTAGDRIKRVYSSDGIPQSYTRYSDVTFQDITNTAEELVVDTTPTIPFVISNLDELQSYPKSRDHYTQKFVEHLKTIVNGYYTAEVTNATSAIDAADFGGTAAQGASITPANIQKMFALAQKKVGRLNTWEPGSMFANLTPDLYQALLEYLGGKESALGDKTGVDGQMGQYYGFDLYVHNSNYWTGTLKLATNPTAGDTVTIKVGPTTITFNFVSSIGTTAGNVLIGGSNDATGASLASLINAPGTTASDRVALSTAAQSALFGCTASYSNSTDLLTLTWRGVGAPVVSSSLTVTSDGWQTGKNISHCMFGVKGAVDMVLQRNIGLDIDKAENRIEEYKIKPFVLFGKKTFADGAKKLVDVKVDTTSYT